MLSPEMHKPTNHTVDEGGCGCCGILEIFCAAPQVLGLYENLVMGQSLMVNHFIFILNKKVKFTCDPSTRGVEGSAGVVGRGTCGEGPYGGMPYCMNYTNH
jgi:hypothetical protein